MRYILMLALFFTCLSAASAADDPFSKRNNDASLRKTQRVKLTVPPAVPVLPILPIRPLLLDPVVTPIPENLGPTR